MQFLSKVTMAQQYAVSVAPAIKADGGSGNVPVRFRQNSFLSFLYELRSNSVKMPHKSKGLTLLSEEKKKLNV